REPLFGELKADPGPGGRFDKKIDDGLAAQGWHLFYGSLADCLECASRIEHSQNFLRTERFNVEQMPASPGHGFSKTTSSGRPASFRTTRTLSTWAVGRFLPTKSALMGNSRCPRSINTANCMRLGRPKSFNASIAARTVRPLNSTSSTK